MLLLINERRQFWNINTFLTTIQTPIFSFASFIALRFLIRASNSPKISQFLMFEVKQKVLKTNYKIRDDHVIKIATSISYVTLFLF